MTDREMTGELPESLVRIREEARAFQEHAEARARTESDWRLQVESFRRDVPAARVEDDGDTIHVGDLSPGCLACKSGRWDCLFVTMRCNLQCQFCLTPRGIPDQPMRSALSPDLSALSAEYARAGVTGVSFSGGEPLLQSDLLIDWVARLRRELPHLYLWAYTNGVQLTSGLLNRLAAVGLNELRFNLAATAYEHPHVLKMMFEAVRRLPSVCIEVPAIPAHRERLLGGLEAWADGGVKYLNLHELIRDDGSPSEQMPGASRTCRMPDGHECAVDPASSELTKSVLARVVQRGLPLAVNYCSLRNKARQLSGRRRLTAPVTLKTHERLREDGTAESVCRFDGGGVHFLHPAEWQNGAGREGVGRVALVCRLLPLQRDGDGQWVRFELVPETAEAL